MEERKLEEICRGEMFVLKLQDNYYCSLKPTQNTILCNYRCETPDKNGLYRCDAASSKYGNILVN